MALTAGTPLASVPGATGSDGLIAIELTTDRLCYVYRSGSDIFARTMTVSGTSISGTGAEQTLAGSRPNTIGSMEAHALTASKIIVIFTELSVAKVYGVVATISGSTITPGSVTDIVPADFIHSTPSPVLGVIDSSKVIIAHSTGFFSSPKIFAVPISGTSFGTAGTSVNIDSSYADFLHCLGFENGTHGMVAYDITTNTYAKGLSVSGTTITLGSRETIESSVTAGGYRLNLIDSDEALLHRNIGALPVIKMDRLTREDLAINTNGDDTWLIPNGSNGIGTTAVMTGTVFLNAYTDGLASGADAVEATLDDITLTVDDANALNVGTNPGSFMIKVGSNRAVMFYNAVDAVVITTDLITATPAEDQLTIAAMPKPVDIDADGTFLYIAALNSSAQPVLIKMTTDLDADGTVIFNPGAGSNIGVQCGREDADTVWIAGDFNGDKVEKSEDAGSTFTVKDPGGYSNVLAFTVGPDSDDRVLIAESSIGFRVIETIDSGANWTVINSSSGLDANAIGRLSTNVQEVVFGNDASATDNINYSVNSGADEEDYSTGFPTQDATGVIVN